MNPRTTFEAVASCPATVDLLERQTLLDALAWNDANGEWRNAEAMADTTDDQLRVAFLIQVIDGMETRA
jgi:hypothetical protein